MFKKTMVFLSACFLLAGVSSVQAYTLTTFDLSADAAATTEVVVHPGAGQTWYSGAPGSGIQYYTSLGAEVYANTVNVTLSADQYYAGAVLGVPLPAPVVDYTVLGSNDSGSTWTQATLVRSANVVYPTGSRDGNDIAYFWTFSDGLEYSTIGVTSGQQTGRMTLTASADWGGPGVRPTGNMVEFDAIAVPAPDAVIVMLSGLGLLGLIVAVRGKNLGMV